MQQPIGFGPPRGLTNARVFGGKVKLKYLLHSGAQASEEAYFTFIPLVYDQPLVVIVLGPMPQQAPVLRQGRGNRCFD